MYNDIRKLERHINSGYKKIGYRLTNRIWFSHVKKNCCALTSAYLYNRKEQGVKHLMKTNNCYRDIAKPVENFVKKHYKLKQKDIEDFIIGFDQGLSKEEENTKFRKLGYKIAIKHGLLSIY